MLKFVICVLIFALVFAQDNRFLLNIIHYNDFHARFVETNEKAETCNPSVAPCVGGFARLATIVRQSMAKERNSLLLNAGDSFQGTIWYNLLRWNATQDFMNMLPHDAHAFGNHEFDNGIDGVVPYLQHLNASVVTANIIDDDEPSIQGLYKPSIVVERDGRKIGIIGVLISTTNVLASTGSLRFTDEIEAVRREAKKLNAEGVNIIVVLSHSGIDIDRDIALHAGPHVDIIVGGHSHTLLYNGEPPNSQFTPQGSYPVIVDQGQRKVLIVQAAAYCLYVGEIKLYFDNAGNLLDWEGHLHYLSNDVEQAPDVLEKINQYLPIVQEKASVEIGFSRVDLSHTCNCGECNLGSLVCDAYMNWVMDKAEGNNWQYAHFCVINRGAIRSAIRKGVVTFESVLGVSPFENNIEVFDLRGDHIVQMLEHSVENRAWTGERMLQVSGLRVIYNSSQPVTSRVVEVNVRCIECDVPRYKPLQMDKYYKVVAQTFLAEGGDEFTMIAENRKNVEIVGVDYDVLQTYVEKQSPIVADVDGRVLALNHC